MDKKELKNKTKKQLITTLKKQKKGLEDARFQLSVKEKGGSQRSARKSIARTLTMLREIAKKQK